MASPPPAAGSPVGGFTFDESMAEPADESAAFEQQAMAMKDFAQSPPNPNISPRQSLTQSPTPSFSSPRGSLASRKNSDGSGNSGNRRVSENGWFDLQKNQEREEADMLAISSLDKYMSDREIKKAVRADAVHGAIIDFNVIPFNPTTMELSSESAPPFPLAHPRLSQPCKRLIHPPRQGKPQRASGACSKSVAGTSLSCLYSTNTTAAHASTRPSK